MTVYDFLSLCTERYLLSVSIYKLSAGVEMWSGAADEIPKKYASCEVCSFDPPENEVICINIE
jgi:hypothetical protein